MSRRTTKRRFLPIEEQDRPRRTITAKSRRHPSIFTYTITSTYLNTYTSLIGDSPDAAARQVLMQPLGSVMALRPDTLTVVPHFLSYGWEPVGVLDQDAIMDWNDQMEVTIIVRGDVIEAQCWDNGDYGLVLDETKAALGDRVKFV